MNKIVHVDSHIIGHHNVNFPIMRRRFEEAGCEFIMACCKTKEEVLEATKDANAIITTYFPIDKEIMANAPDLRVVIRNAVGFEILDIEGATELGIPICNIPDYCSVDVAYHTIALIMALEKKLKVSNKNVEKGVWSILAGYPIYRVCNQTLGLIGFGRIGKNVARFAKGLDMNVVVYDPYLPDEVFAENGVKRVSLDELFRISDVVTINTLLTEETRNLVNKDSIARMKDGVIIINTSRGAMVNTNDLLDAIDAGKVKAAGLDVLAEEPLRDPDARVLKYDNVIVTSHIGMDSEDATADNFTKCTDTVLSILLKGELTYNVLNKKALQERNA